MSYYPVSKGEFDIEIITRPRIDITRLSADDFKTQRAPTLEEIESKYIAQIVKLFLGNHSLASEALGITRRTLYTKCRKYGIPTPRELPPKKPRRKK